MAASLSPKIQDLAARLNRDPDSKIFLQLAEEYRKEGLLEEALLVCKGGLKKHPGYQSARVALGRIFLSLNQLEEARAELEAVLRGAPDNLLANRLLGDLLVKMGDKEAALERYRAVHMYGPSDPDIAVKIQKLEGKQAAAPPPPQPAAPTPPATSPGPASTADRAASALRPANTQFPTPVQRRTPEPPPAAERAPKPQASRQAPTPAEAAAPHPTLPPAAPVPDHPPAAAQGSALPPAAEPAPVVAPRPSVSPPAEAAVPAPSPPPVDRPWDEAGAPSAPPPAEPATAEEARPSAAPPRAEPVAAPDPAPVQESPAIASAPQGGAASPAGPQSQATVQGGLKKPRDGINTETLAELYVRQGFIERAMDVYRCILSHEPENRDIQRRLRELEPMVLKKERVEAPVPPPSAPLLSTPPAAQDPAGTVKRLERWLKAIQAGRP